MSVPTRSDSGIVEINEELLYINLTTFITCANLSVTILGTSN